MPLYSFHCKDCNHEYEAFNKKPFTDQSDFPNCKNCNSTNVEQYIEGCNFIAKDCPSHEMGWEKNLNENLKAMAEDKGYGRR